MKNILYLLLVVPFCLNAQNVSIPDSFFLNRLLILGVDTNNDGLISYSEAANVNSLIIDHDSISSLVGIGAFINISILDCSFNYFLDSLDLAQNTSLEELDASNCNLQFIGISLDTLLKVVDLSVNSLTSINFSGNSKLEIVECGANDIDSIDISNLSSLIWLDFIANNIVAIDLSSNPLLKYLNCVGNNLTSIDISNNPILEILNCAGNDLSLVTINNNDSLESAEFNENNLMHLNVSGAPNLEYLGCANNQLNNLVVQNSTKLKNLSLTNNNLDTLNLTNCFDLWGVTVENNKLKALILHNNYALEYLFCSRNELQSIDLSGAPVVDLLECQENLFQNIVIDHPTLRALICGKNPLLSLIDISKTTSIKTFSATSMPQNITVCVWILPFPPINSGINVSDQGSPNITYDVCSFTLLENRIPDTIRIYPNPSNDFLNISKSSHLLACKAVLTDQMGRTVKTLDWKIVSEKGGISLEGIEQGLYFLYIQSESRVYSEIIIKL